MTEPGDEFRARLLADGVIGEAAELTPLTGGVSSDIYLVDDRGERFVIKRALEMLKVADAWRADVSRNRYEVRYLALVGRFLPDSVPKVLFHDENGGYFGMEYLGDGYANWKSLLMGGECCVDRARVAGETLGMIHRRTWDDQTVRSEFETTSNFQELRLDPYLLTTADRVPEVAPILGQEANRVRESRSCLVHGDFSPKNLLFRDERLIVLDCEVAWYGDPAFDVAFLLNHLMLKALHVDRRCLELVRAAWSGYLGSMDQGDPGASLPVLLPGLMLARVEGKSPVEYLTAQEQDQVRRFAVGELKSPASSLEETVQRWASVTAASRWPSKRASICCSAACIFHILHHTRVTLEVLVHIVLRFATRNT